MRKTSNWEKIRKYVVIYRTIFSFVMRKLAISLKLSCFSIENVYPIQILSLFIQKPRNTEQNTKCPVLLSEFGANSENSSY